MVRAELIAFVANLGAYYEKFKEPSTVTVDLWLKKVESIPYECLSWVHDKITSESEMFPKNLPMVMWALYHAWLDAHPDKRAHREHVDCPDCEAGWLTLQKVVTNKFGLPMYRDAIPTFAWPCGKCRQIPSKQYRTLFQAMEEGFERVNLKSHTAARRNLKEMVDSIGRPVPQPRVYCD